VILLVQVTHSHRVVASLIRRFSTTTSTWWLWTRSNLTGKKSKKQPENSESDNS